ncbi:MAG TPA: Gfo/Idh/MocA family oxidoreductase [Dermatophilaceae bacterium]|nr:Gfo/Idh/MocA family oxidoreductase [Dermatophilaceae bacterium]
MPLPSALPPARTPDPMAAPPLRWGVLGTGWIADRFVAALLKGTRQQVVAVGSRSAGPGGDFAARHGIARSHASYAALVADPAVDVVYVATPHPKHLDHALLAISAGKHVLVEKPLALNAAQGRTIAAAASRAGVFCMEAMWTFFLPKFDVIDQLLADGALGRVSAVVADFGESFEATHRIMRADLAGGPLLDLGTYPIAFALKVIGVPRVVRAVGTAHPDAPSGVNGQLGVLLGDGNQRQAVIHTSILGSTPTGATVVGGDASLVIEGPFYQPGGFTVTATDGRRLHYREEPAAHAGLFWQAAELARCVAAGQTGSPRRPLADSIATLAVMDEVRRQVGIVFPDEQAR